MVIVIMEQISGPGINLRIGTKEEDGAKEETQVGTKEETRAGTKDGGEDSKIEPQAHSLKTTTPRPKVRPTEQFNSKSEVVDLMQIDLMQIDLMQID